ncbi:hypothetical protein [Pseudarthrobacter sp. PS3-L1]|uniref:hypothetical protein n=1 Tax=Pseudarthrobacter sp. PS3-L1 TaxID=3046207 RepID=UPI0024BB3289|nr:hypothetical protein [Pseudarthrobacter sp. PS3-L1]MDJ0319784.1 hypothetical protein [Pseudarthrobacter sp. PS3-L1]
MSRAMIRTGARAATPKPVTPAKTTVTTGAVAKSRTKAATTGLSFSPAGHRYKLDGLPVTGVTTLIGEGVPKGALIPWAAEMAALWAMDHLEQLPVMPADEAVREMKWAWRKHRDDAGATGTAVHKMAEQLSRTGEVDADADLLGYVEGFAAFLDEWQITPVLLERPCGNRTHHYAGTFDMYATSPLLAGGKLVQIDLKTSKGVYGETALQLAAYARAEFYIDEDGNEQPMPEVFATYVAHVTPMDREGAHARYGDRPLGTSLYPMADSPEQINEHMGWFLAAAYTAKAKKARELLAREPLTHPAKEMSIAS